jgi:hypothetical protein
MIALTLDMKTTTDNFRYGMYAITDVTFNGARTVTVIANSQNPGIRSRTVGDNFADWKARIARGENATTTLVGTWDEVQQRPAYATSFRPIGTPVGRYVTVWGNPYNILTGLFAPSDVKSKSNSLALSSFLKRASSKRSAFQGGVFMGELKETIHSIRHPAQALRSGINSYVRKSRKIVKRMTKRGRPHGGRLIADALSGTWLEFQYGWKPLVSDIEDGFEALSRIREESLPRLMVRSAKGSGLYEGTVPPDAGPISTGDSQMQWTYKMRNTYLVDTKYYGVVKLELDSSLKPLASRVFGFSWENFIPTVWELIPYSFLVDYFTNIGDVISAACFPTSGLEWVSKTTFEEGRSTAVSFEKVFWTADTVVTHWDPGSSTAFRRVVNRAPYSGSLIPSLVLSVPGDKSLKWLNIAALANLRFAPSSKRGFSL